jgi:hypothetical protein
MLPGTQSWSFMVDCCIPDCDLSELLSHYLGRIPYRCAEAPEKHIFIIQYPLGQLYLGVFSGPVEGIIMIVVIYLLTGVYGMLTVLCFLHSFTKL